MNGHLRIRIISIQSPPRAHRVAPAGLVKVAQAQFPESTISQVKRGEDVILFEIRLLGVGSEEVDCMGTTSMLIATGRSRVFIPIKCGRARVAVRMVGSSCSR